FGALTTLFLFLSINRLVKNEIISLASTLVFAFIKDFWFVANRLEFDTLNSFFIILVIYSAILYNEYKTRKYLYFFFFSWGLGLTNHPIAFFVIPAIVLYVVIVNPRIFKSVKAIFVSILFFILPLLSYFYILIRSRQGYGEVTDLKKLFYYVTGRKVTGEVHGGHFFDRPISQVLSIIKDYLLIMYNNFGIVLVIIAVAGFVFLLRRNLKFGICSVLLIVFNLIVPPLYLGYANPNYVIDSMLIITFYIAFGFLLIYKGVTFLLSKVSKLKPLTSFNEKRSLKFENLLRYSLVGIVFLFFFYQPVSLIRANYKEVDLSQPLDVYKFWNEAFSLMEESSKIYVMAKSANIGMFVDKYEYPEKNITFVRNNSEEYDVKNMIDDLGKGITVYFVGNSKFLNTIFETQQIGRTYYWPRFDETLKLYKIIRPVVNLEIGYTTDSFSRRFGQVFTVLYFIRNKNPDPIKIDSLELELPDNIKLEGVEPGGDINQLPGMSRGIYMWVSDSYVVGGNSEINLILKLRAIRPGKSIIKFRATSHGGYIECEDLKIEVLSEGVGSYTRNYLPIIGLHSIESHIGNPIELYTRHFENLCKTLKDYGYETITFQDLLNYLDYGRTLPDKAVIITSDDGFQD
ncbi:MAG: DUF2723 domain-containing protein, partial [Actinobacteria bacterium]|nr:DUF2723 domain-containing protein [Actinomycetota bacterium]